MIGKINRCCDTANRMRNFTNNEFEFATKINEIVDFVNKMEKMDELNNSLIGNLRAYIDQCAGKIHKLEDKVEHFDEQITANDACFCELVDDVEKLNNKVFGKEEKKFEEKKFYHNILKCDCGGSLYGYVSKIEGFYRCGLCGKRIEMLEKNC